MTIRLFCDACKKETKSAETMKFLGHTFDDGKKVEYWEGHVCYPCQVKMRHATGIPKLQKVKAVKE